jgi:glycine/D-amino acid oxidase-like deaminating enzyme/nitrite reductase/ring-hydroxylating ferredoxin subunit
MDSTHPSLPGKPISLWLDTTPKTDYPTLPSELAVDVVVVGGGIAGLTVSTLLKEAGRTVAVLEADRIVRGVTGNTTAKVTALHALIYDDLIRHFGEEKARTYAEANQTAIEWIATRVDMKQIDCDFIRTAAYTYTEAPGEVELIRAETAAALKLGLPATFVEETPLPFAVQAAVRFDNQARFHPRKYLLALAQDIPGEGSHIFEQTRVLDIREGETESDRCQVITERGTVLARDVVVASHFPMVDKAFYYARMAPHRSHVLAVRIDGPTPPGLFISTTPVHSMRSQPVHDGELLFIGGEGYKTGQGGDTVARYRRLEAWARERFPVKAVEYRWATQDNRTFDRLPYIGRATPNARHLFLATGFGGWGMTNGTAAGLLLSDLILNRENPWATVYDPNRFTLAAAPQFVKDGVNVAAHLIGDRFGGEEPDGVSPGEGGIVRTDQGQIALYKEPDGTIHRLSAKCTHMGCTVQWNPAEISWDCPCHGSRFGADGKVIHGPALKDLEASPLA